MELNAGLDLFIQEILISVLWTKSLTVWSKKEFRIIFDTSYRH